MAKHTPGPWTVEDPMGPEHLSIVEAGKQPHEWRFIATVSLEDAPAEILPAEARANARLIAAAPDLLEAVRLALPALEWARKMLADNPQMVGGIPVEAILRAAITKATTP